MIDIHCHILPGIDDGPATVAEAVALARAAVAAGTTQIVATPYVSSDHPHNPAASIAEGGGRAGGRPCG
ncbi:MAG: CpsB/CapC family capsule biosynthesis tyrosine phosphatase [Solirubrobacteraceae bacterium]